MLGGEGYRARWVGAGICEDAIEPNQNEDEPATDLVTTATACSLCLLVDFFPSSPAMESQEQRRTREGFYVGKRSDLGLQMLMLQCMGTVSSSSQGPHTRPDTS
ncbi:hypothetical protein AAY473_026377 [Plecturocebus cupreus]